MHNNKHKTSSRTHRDLHKRKRLLKTGRIAISDRAWKRLCTSHARAVFSRFMFSKLPVVLLEDISPVIHDIYIDNAHSDGDSSLLSSASTIISNDSNDKTSESSNASSGSNTILDDNEKQQTDRLSEFLSGLSNESESEVSQPDFSNMDSILDRFSPDSDTDEDLLVIDTNFHKGSNEDPCMPTLRAEHNLSGSTMDVYIKPPTLCKQLPELSTKPTAKPTAVPIENTSNSEPMKEKRQCVAPMSSMESYAQKFTLTNSSLLKVNEYKSGM